LRTYYRVIESPEGKTVMSNTDLPSSTHETTADVFDMDGTDTQDELVGADTVDDDDLLDDADEVVDDDDDFLDDDDDDDGLAIEDDDDDLLSDEDE
jgi:ribonuclease E